MKDSTQRTVSVFHNARWFVLRRWWALRLWERRALRPVRRALWAVQARVWQLLRLPGGDASCCGHWHPFWICGGEECRGCEYGSYCDSVPECGCRGGWNVDWDHYLTEEIEAV